MPSNEVVTRRFVSVSTNRPVMPRSWTRRKVSMMERYGALFVLPTIEVCDDDGGGGAIVTDAIDASTFPIPTMEVPNRVILHFSYTKTSPNEFETKQVQ